jgi:hypothetical protein
MLPANPTLDALGATMRFRLGLFIGLAIGYTLGAKAGTERYQQILSLWNQIVGSEKGQQITDEVRHAADLAGDAIERKASEGVDKVAQAVGGEDDGDSSGSPRGFGSPGAAGTIPPTGTIPPG